ncbi:glycosyltransferase 61 family protein [Glutamicibacter sp. BW77]|uniref:glycosyltransferase family 61 protein n=1 Tax=Glutamicibacter sp. BW77 TaxID=2024402 RepID=UPI000BB8C6D1|nr:glycosyltransferase 61 family protein [Glutamicibacter sp. BW77]PCC31157.1 hypothetical protein CIK74_18115 [Glutamicibacter sp. BW77]
MQSSWITPEPTLSNDVSMMSVSDATVTPFNVTNLDGKRRMISGAVYQNGRLLPSSQRASGEIVVSEDPSVINGHAGFNSLSGRWLYGGHWMNHFGHFISESLTTLWPRIGDIDGILFHPFIFGSTKLQWQHDFLNQLGMRLPILISRQGCIVEELIVPQRSVILNKSCAPQAVDVWKRISVSGRPAMKVFLSRSRLGSDPRAIQGDVRLDSLMKDLGFNIFYPETISIAEQLDLAANASILAGVSGSALHVSAFSHAKTKVLEIGDQRSPRRALANQLLIDGASGRSSAFVPLVTDHEGRDIKRTAALMEGLL